MSIVNTLTLESNRQIKINFDGGDLSSDAGLLLIKEFAAKIGFTKLIKKKFKTNDEAVRFHKDAENLLQMIYQVISAYFQDDCADELTLDPVFLAVLGKESLASQPTLSRFFNRMDEDTLVQFNDIDKKLRDIIYSIKRPEHMLFDLDSTLFAIQNLKPSPFCLLDEIEAALDDSNVGRFAGYLQKLTKNTQFIIITHRRGTMNAADRLYGITMQEKGVSTLVSVDLVENQLTQ